MRPTVNPFARFLFVVIPGLDPGIHAVVRPLVDGWVKPGHDARWMAAFSCMDE